MVFLGIVCGSATGAFVFQRFEYKTILWISLLLNGVFLYLFTMFEDYYILSLARFASGFN